MSQQNKFLSQICLTFHRVAVCFELYIIYVLYSNTCGDTIIFGYSFTPFSPNLKNNSKREKSERFSSDDDLGKSKAVTGKELDQLEELSVRLDTLLELLSEKGIVSKKEYTSNVMMRLHETSKAKGFEELDEEI